MKKWRLKEIESDETFHLWTNKYQWYCTEKIKGAKQVGIVYDNGEVWFQGGKSNQLPPPRYVEKLQKHIKLISKRDMLRKKFGKGKYVIYTVFYGKNEDYVVVDIYNVNTKRFLSNEQLMFCCSDLFMPKVATMFHGTIDEAIEYVKTEPNSMYVDGKKIDGLICRPFGDFYRSDGSRIWLKLECDEYVRGKRMRNINE